MKGSICEGAVALRMVAVTALLLSVGRVGHGQQLRTLDHVLLGSSSVLIAVDWLQTIDIARRGLPETNRMLGRHPSVGRVNTLVGLGLVTNVVVVKVPHRTIRRLLWGGVLVMESIAVVTNGVRGVNLSVAF